MCRAFGARHLRVCFANSIDQLSPQIFSRIPRYSGVFREAGNSPKVRTQVRTDLERVAGIEPASSAWKAEVLPLNYTRGVPATFLLSLWWWGKDLNLRRLSRQIYSLIPLTTREPHPNCSPRAKRPFSERIKPLHPWFTTGARHSFFHLKQPLSPRQGLFLQSLHCSII